MRWGGVAILFMLLSFQSFARELRSAADAPVAPKVTDMREACEPPAALSLSECEGGADQKEGVYLAADRADMSADGGVALEGEVCFQQRESVVRAMQMRYDSQAQILSVEGGVRMELPELTVEAASLVYQPSVGKGEIQQARYRLQHASGKGGGTADQIQLQGEGKALLKKASFSTCPGDTPDWSLHARSLQLDVGRDLGQVWHTSFRVGGVPIFYTPYLDFSLSGQPKSGFLVPEIHRDRLSGQMISLPWYLSLAPNMDATISPHFYQQRGLGVGLEWRRLDRWHSTVLEGTWIPDDRLVGEERYQGQIRHQGRLGSQSRHQWVWRRVSDAQWSNTFARALEDQDENRLLSYGNIAYRWGPWHIGLYAENWQEWETQSEPLYARQPEIRLTGYHQLSASFYQDTQITLANFAATDTALPEVFRTDIATRLGWRAEKGWGYLEPSLTLRATHYEQSAGAQTRLLPVVEFESGLFLERSLTWKAGRESFLRQTLEPKVMFRWVPYENQEALPRLDTDWADSATAMVLGQDRFLGVDRIGDTRQVTFLMASDLLDGVSGKTLAQAMVVRNLYLEDRRVSLSAADPVQTERWSGTAFTLQLYPGRKGWVTASLLTEPDNRGLQEGYLGIRYEKGPHRYFQLERTWVRAETLNAQSSELTLRAGTPIRYNLLATVESRYAVEAQQWRENLAELAYHTCCWAINLSWRQTFPDMQDRGSRNQSVSIGFELKGLGEDRSRRATAQ